MSAITFDTHRHIKQLQSKGITEEQAEAIIDVIKDSRIENNDNMVSKPDLQQYKSDMRADFRLLESKVESLENKMAIDFQGLENRIQKEISPIRTQMAVMMWTQGLIVLTIVVPATKQMLGL